MPINIKNYKLALIGLIILFAFSMVMAGGGRPPEMYQATKIIRLSSNETEIIDNAYLHSVKIIPAEEVGRSWYKFETHPLLANIFPQVKFYLLVSSVSEPPTTYFRAEFNGKFYRLPAEFNYLMLDNNLEVNDRTVIDLTKAFVVIASQELVFTDVPLLELRETVERERYTRGLPPITFWETKKNIEMKKSPPIYRVYLKTEIGGKMQTWSFHIRYGLFQWGTKMDEGSSITHYYDFVIPEKEHKRGELDLNGEIEISTAAPSKATVECGKYGDTSHISQTFISHVI
jgi:hypothetical protein